MDVPDRADVESLVDRQPLAPFVTLSYDPPAETVDDLESTTEAEVDRLPLEGLEPGATVAVGVGSRGVHRIDEVASTVVAALADRGFEPTVVPAMGSHGGATAEGQLEVLEALGITEESVGAPIDARMDAEPLGEVEVGETTATVHFSTAAREADAIVVINRVKPHTNFTGRVESGLAKMSTVGLGKQPGANAFHSTAIEEGYVPTIETFLSVVAAETPLLGGIALVENFDEETAHVEAIPVDAFLEREPALLERARREMPTLPTDEVDLLVVDEIGKEISGAGMDTNVIGRYRVLNAPDPETPAIKLIYVRSLTEATKGNASGIGLADLTRRSVIEDLDFGKTYANAITSGSLSKVKLPMVAPDDELAVQIALGALGGYDPSTARIVWIENTTDLSELRVSEPLVEELADADGVTVGRRERLAFDDGTATFEPIE